MRPFKRYLRLIAILGIAVSLLSLLGRQGIWFEMLSHFAVQYCVVLAVIAAFLFAERDRLIGVLTLAVALLHLTRFAGDVYAGERSESASGREVTVVSLNILSTNSRFDLVNAYLKQANPDVLLICELSAAARQQVDFAGLGLTRLQEVVRDDNFGMGIYARVPAKTSAVIYPGGVTTPVLDATFDGFRVLGIHPTPPMNAAALDRRDAQLFAVAQMAVASAVPVVVMGDFNMTPWSPYFSDFMAMGRFQDSRKLAHAGLQRSWPANSWILRIPIDHVLVSKGIDVTNREIGPDVGSDHFPVFARLRIP